MRVFVYIGKCKEHKAVRCMNNYKFIKQIYVQKRRNVIMKKQKIKLIGLLRTVLLSWGMLLLVFACTIASTYPEV